MSAECIMFGITEEGALVELTVRMLHMKVGVGIIVSDVNVVAFVSGV